MSSSLVSSPVREDVPSERDMADFLEVNDGMDEVPSFYFTDEVPSSDFQQINDEVPSFNFLQFPPSDFLQVNDELPPPDFPQFNDGMDELPSSTFTTPTLPTPHESSDLSALQLSPLAGYSTGFPQDFSLVDDLRLPGGMVLLPSTPPFINYSSALPSPPPPPPSTLLGSVSTPPEQTILTYHAATAPHQTQAATDSTPNRTTYPSSSKRYKADSARTKRYNRLVSSSASATSTSAGISKKPTTRPSKVIVDQNFVVITSDMFKEFLEVSDGSVMEVWALMDRVEEEVRKEKEGA